MTYLRVLVEGESDVPVVREALSRGLAMKHEDYRIFPHRGRGTVPRDPHRDPARANRTLLAQLPAKLRAWGKESTEGYVISVLVLVDADDDDCRELKQSILELIAKLEGPMPRVIVRIAVEETESWFLAQPEAVRRAYPRANVAQMRRIEPDAICSAAERLAESLGLDPTVLTGAQKVAIAEAIAPHLDLESRRSPSFRALIDGLRRITESPS